jgi:tetratricopeptide (TPR) repeat protein
MHIHGGNEPARIALDRSLAIAEQNSDAPNEAGLLGMLHMFHFRVGDYNTALNYAKRCKTLANKMADPPAVALAHSILGRSLLMMGDLSDARAELEALFKIWSPFQQSSTIYLVHDRHFRAGIALARTLWLQGHPAQAVERARETIKGAERMDHPASLTVLLAWAGSIFLWTGDLLSAEEHISSSIAIAESYSLDPLAAVGRARKAQLMIGRGDAKNGVASLQASLEQIHEVRYELITTEFYISLAQGLAAIGQFSDAIEVVDEAIRQVQAKGDTCYTPELLRVKAGLLQLIPPLRTHEAEACLAQSLELGRRQGARAWELRTATDLSVLLANQGHHDRARALLQPVFEQLTEGFDTNDLRAAERMLTSLQ